MTMTLSEGIEDDSGGREEVLCGDEIVTGGRKQRLMMDHRAIMKSQNCRRCGGRACAYVRRGGEEGRKREAEDSGRRNIKRARTDGRMVLPRHGGCIWEAWFP